MLCVALSALALEAKPVSPDYKKLKLRSANLQVGLVGIAPVKHGKVQMNKNLRLSFEIKNVGNKATDNNAKYTLKCIIIKGTQCPIASSTGKVPYIAAGSSRSIILISASQAKPGKYRLTITLKPTTSRGRPYTRDIEVAGRMKLIPRKRISGRRLSAAQMKIVRRFPKMKTKWVHVSCIQVPPVEFPKPKFTNTDTITMPKFSEILYMTGSKPDIKIKKLTSALAPGQSVYGPSVVPGKSSKCVAVGRMKVFK
jgi:hypothetical protein